MSGFRRGSQFVDALDVQRGIEHRHGLRADALQAEQVENGRWKLLEQFLVIAAVACLGQLADASGEILADPRYRPKLLLVELDDGLWPGRERLGSRVLFEARPL